MSDWRIARLILRTVIAVAKALLKIIGNNEAAQKHCDPAEEPDIELPRDFYEEPKPKP